MSRGSSVVELMHDVLSKRPAFDSLVVAVSAWRWIATTLMEGAIPATYLPGLFPAAVVRRPSAGPDRRRRFALGDDLALSSARRRAHADRGPGRGSEP